MSPNAEHCFWTTIGGVTLPIKSMTSTHLLNSIRMMERNAPMLLQHALGAAYSFLSSVQGEQAEYEIENSIRDLEYADPEEELAYSLQFWCMVCLAHHRDLISDEEWEKWLHLGRHQE